MRPGVGLKFHGNPITMTAATVPMLYLWLNRYSVESNLGFFALVLDVASTALALFFGLSPAFFPRVDHPLHSLDRMRWLSGCVGIVFLFLFAICSNGAVHAFMQLHPAMHLSIKDYTEARVSKAGLITLDAKLDLERIGATAHCSDCSASECARKDCRAQLDFLPLFSENALLRTDDLDGYEVSPEMRQLSEVKTGNGTMGRRLSGAGGGGGGGGGGGSGSKRTCSITCIYAAPLVPEDSGPGAVPSAWAVGSSKPPRGTSGTVNFHWWTGGRNDYKRAISEVVAKQLPERLKACDGRQAVTSSKDWWGSCTSYGFVDCRTRDLAGKCCCPVGQKPSTDGCEPCGDLRQRIRALHELPLLYSLDEDSGQYSFHFMLFLSFVLLPLPWALMARGCWHLMEPKLQESFLQHEMRTERKQIAETWIGASSLHGPWTIQVASMSGDCREVPGLSESSYLVHLRRTVAEVFSVDFHEVGLVFGSQLLGPDLDFRSLSELGMGDGCAVSFVLSKVETTPREERMAGSSEGSAFAFFRRNRNVYKAVQCRHLGQLRYTQGTVGNFGREYTKGWNCDGCERHFAPGTGLWRCDICRIDFCQDCSME